jgi:hypothetical protein
VEGAPPIEEQHLSGNHAVCSEASRASGWPKRCEMAHVLQEYSYKRLKLAQPVWADSASFSLERGGRIHAVATFEDPLNELVFFRAAVRGVAVEIAVIALAIGLHPIETLEKQRLNMIGLGNLV